MLDRQLEAFLGGERLADMTLGLAATCERVAALVSQQRREGSAPEATPLADAILGILSIRSRLWAALAVAAGDGRRGAEPPEPPAPPVVSPRLLR